MNKPTAKDLAAKAQDTFNAYVENPTSDTCDIAIHHNRIALNGTDNKRFVGTYTKRLATLSDAHSAFVAESAARAAEALTPAERKTPTEEARQAWVGNAAKARIALAEKNAAIQAQRLSVYEALAGTAIDGTESVVLRLDYFRTDPSERTRKAAAEAIAAAETAHQAAHAQADTLKDRSHIRLHTAAIRRLRVLAREVAADASALEGAQAA